MKAAGHVSDRLCVAGWGAGLVSQVESVLKEIEPVCTARAANQHHASYFELNWHTHTQKQL